MVNPPLVIPGAYMVTIGHTCFGRDIDNVIGITGNGAGTQDAEEVASVVGNAWQRSGGPLSKTTAFSRLTKVHVVDIGSETGPVVEHTYSADGGYPGGQIATMAACALISWHGGTRSRRGNGRMYFGPLLEENVNQDGRTLTTNWVTNLNSAFAQFKADIEAAELTWVTLSRVGKIATPVVNPTAQGTIATQRRRLR
jgi:hypothetical protein